MNLRALAVLISTLWMVSLAAAGEPRGTRPYEMVWAGRDRDTRAALVDFENLDGWAVQCVDAAADFGRSEEQPLWGRHVGRLTYRGSGPKPAVTIRPPKPIPLPEPFDCLNLWVYGNNWAWQTDRSTPQVDVVLVLRSAAGQEFPVPLGRVRWKEWWLMHERLSPSQIKMLGSGASLAAIQVLGGRNVEDRRLYFDNLAVYHEELPPLTFEPRPARGIRLFEGQSPGTNTGPGKLPFPTREETILPDQLTPGARTSLEPAGEAFEFHYRGADGHLVYRYRPASGTLGDVAAGWEGRGGEFQPMADGGIRFWSDAGEAQAPERIEPVACRREGDTVVATWRCRRGKRTAEVTYTLRLWQKSLVVDVRCPGGEVGEVGLGRSVGADEPRLVTLPFLTGDRQRPAVLVMGPEDRPLFLMALMDHCRSNASSLWAVNRVAEDGAACNGGSRYLPRTDGRRNDCFERIFLTVSPTFEEVLPNIPNPPSPWMQVAGPRLWRAHGASVREQDYEFWKRIARHGMTKVVITDHETGWRDGGESFTFRSRAAPGKGGDEGQADYARRIHALGFRYGIYNNYTDYAPVNEFWDEDRVTRVSDGNWRTAWARCYNPKPARAVEFEARLAPLIQEKFHLDTAYCDVHTAVRPWDYVDFDARVPGAGTFAATFYAYGEIMLHQKRTWNGPVYSEGNNHWYYCGLTDGNYGQDQAARLDENPWLVDFDLRKMHPLCCNFGMGNPGMFYGRGKGLGESREEQDARLDRFLAATLAFGHTGFLVTEGGMENTVRSYYALQPIHARYARQTAARIRYADEKGRLLDTTAAVACGAFRRSQIVTEYADGLTVTVNGNPTESWKTPDAELPPNGWYACDKAGTLRAMSAAIDGHRVDYVDCPEHLYADGRGRFTRLPKAACDGPTVALPRADGGLEVIPVGRTSTFAVGLDGRTATAVALDEAGQALGPAATRLSRGLVHIMPVPKAFSYLLAPADPPGVTLTCPRDRVVPGETVTVQGRSPHTWTIPADAPVGKLVWHEADGAWIDFLVVPLVEASLRLDGALHLELLPHAAGAVDAEVALAGQSRRAKLQPGEPLRLQFPLAKPQGEEVRALPLRVSAGPLAFERAWWLKTEDKIVPVASLSPEIQPGLRLRGSAETPLADATGAQVQWRSAACGGESQDCLFMHPPYRTAVGYAFALFPPIDLPAEPKAVLRCQLGKADGSDPGDGILFRVAVVDAEGRETEVARRQWIEHAWSPLEADLAAFAGRRVRIKLIADVGPADNSSGDWACWSGLRVESRDRVPSQSLSDVAVEPVRRPGPLPPWPGSLEQLRQVRSAVLHFQAIGLEHGGSYVCKASLNGIPLGALPGAGGDEERAVWADARLPLPAEAVARLEEWNLLRIDNSGGDSFKIRGFWLELTAPDGAKSGSPVTGTTFTQPPGWKHAEGTAVAADEPIRLEIRVPLQAAKK